MGNKSFFYTLVDLSNEDVIDQIELKEINYELALEIFAESNVMPELYKISYEEIDYGRTTSLLLEDEDELFGDEDDDYFADEDFFSTDYL